MIGDSEQDLVDRSKDDPLLLEYDHLKHLSTLSLVALGGILSLAQTQAKLESKAMLIAVILVAAGGASALGCLEQIVRSRRTGKILGQSYRVSRWFAVSAFSLGIGAFLAVFLELFK